jgi:glutathione S-transferase
VCVGERRFFGGDAPGLVDVHLFGVLRSVAGEGTGQYALAHAHPRLPAWYHRMQDLITPASRHQEGKEEEEKEKEEEGNREQPKVV